MKDKLQKYLVSDRHIWWTVTVLPGVYAISYLYLNNFSLINSWQQLVSFLFWFIGVPILEIMILDGIFKKWLAQKRGQLYWSYFLINFSIIFSLSIYLGWRWKALLLFAVVAISTSFFLARHYKKLVLLLGFMTVLALGQLGYYYFKSVLPAKDWVVTKEFETYEFIRKPNIYLIQPDGFVGKNAVNNALYQFEMDDFYRDMKILGFGFNHEFRSNYATTLSSNSALFTGTHHYHNGEPATSELLHARDIILGNNPVLRTFKNNGYRTHLILEHSYLMLNYPDVAYDTNNVSNSELSSLLPNYHLGKDYMNDFKRQMSLNKYSEQPQFYFVEILHPSHISPTYEGEDSIKEGRATYLDDLKSTSETLVNIARYIKSIDPEGIVIIAADHGGFVGFTHTGQATSEVTKNPELKQSIFSALFAVTAPDDFKIYQDQMKSSVSVFPLLFDYLADKSVTNKGSFDHSSYLQIKKGADKGLYLYFNTEGIPTTEKVKL